MNDRFQPLRRIVRQLQGERRARRRGGRRVTDQEPNRGWIPALIIAGVVAVVDWSTKAFIAARVPLYGFEEVIEGKVAFWHMRNHAMILGLYGNLPLEYRKAIAMICGVMGALLLFEVVSRGKRLPPRRRKWAWIFVGLASGGMLGNLGERVVHWGVTDYLSLHWNGLWLPPGNLADLAIFLSIPVAAVVICFELLARMQREEDDAGVDDTTLDEEFAAGTPAPTPGR